MAKAKRSEAFKRLLAGLDVPDSQDPAGFGREDVAAKLMDVAGTHRQLSKMWAFLHSPDYSRAELARRLRALKG